MTATPGPLLLQRIAWWTGKMMLALVMTLEAVGSVVMVAAVVGAHTGVLVERAGTATGRTVPLASTAAAAKGEEAKEKGKEEGDGVSSNFTRFSTMPRTTRWTARLGEGRRSVERE